MQSNKKVRNEKCGLKSLPLRFISSLRSTTTVTKKGESVMWSAIFSFACGWVLKHAVSGTYNYFYDMYH